MDAARQRTKPEYITVEQLEEKVFFIVDKRMKDILVYKEDFSEIKGLLKDITSTMVELGEAQRNTEQKMAELAEAQKNTEQKMAELGEAQRNTEARLSELAEEQRESRKDIGRLDKTMQELAEAQKNTEIKVSQLAEEQRESRKDIGRLDKTMQELTELHKESRKDINRLDKTMQELTELHKESRKDINRLDKTMQELAEAQKNTEIKVNELAEQQKRTERAIETLTKTMIKTRSELGGLGQSFGYALENEAYRVLPSYLKRVHNIDVVDRFIRTEINGQEVNIFARAKRADKELLVVGESKTKLDSVDDLKKLRVKVKAVRDFYGTDDIVRVLITHYCKPTILNKAKEQDIIVVQSYEW